MPAPPNILFFMTDQMQGRVLDPDHPCRTPYLDQLAARGVRFTRGYTPNAVCSPARASLMTGLLPHNHGVLEVTHVVDDDQSCLRTEKPHWAPRLAAAGYRMAYHGKWHVERSEQLDRFGWHEFNCGGGSGRGKDEFSPVKRVTSPPGYRQVLHYGVTDRPAAQRGMGIVTERAYSFIQGALTAGQPWCCFVSLQEPHDPFVCGREAYSLYDVDKLPLAANVYDDLAGRPGLYRKAARAWADLTEKQKREAAACYYASITEIDQQFGRLYTLLDAAGALDNTIVIFTSDHGELLGAHGLYCKNISGYEEVYHVPLVVAAPGLGRGISAARVGLHDLCPTILELAGADPIDGIDGQSFVPALRDPAQNSAQYAAGFAEYHGGRYRLTQRIYWKDSWKIVLNGFDFDELYDLAADPDELHNLIDAPECAGKVAEMMAGLWQKVRESGDHSLLNSYYPALRLAACGPEVAGEH